MSTFTTVKNMIWEE